MYLVRVGWRIINLEYMIESADSALGAPPNEAPRGGIRVAIYPGKMFDVTGEDAAKLRVHLEDNVKPIPARKEPDRKPPQRAKRGAAMRTGSLAASKSSSKDE